VERILDVLGDMLYGAMFTNYFIRRNGTPKEQAADILDIALLACWRMPNGRTFGPRVSGPPATERRQRRPSLAHPEPKIAVSSGREQRRQWDPVESRESWQTIVSGGAAGSSLS